MTCGKGEESRPGTREFRLDLIVLQRIVDAAPEGIRPALGSRRGGKPAPAEVLALEESASAFPGTFARRAKTPSSALVHAFWRDNTTPTLTPR
jgi:hypothetical protein